METEVIEMLTEAEQRLGGYMGENYKAVEELRARIRAWLAEHT